jgi:hypothetical protein
MDEQDDQPVWKALVTNEVLWVAIGAGAILVLAFYLATR